MSGVAQEPSSAAGSGFSERETPPARGGSPATHGEATTPPAPDGRAAAPVAGTNPAASGAHEFPPEGRPFGRYRLTGRLGVGGMGVVWKAWDPQLGRALAIKQIRDAAAAEESSRARFLREARIASRLRHPNIVAVHDVGEVDGIPFLAMDCVEGRDWESFVVEGAEDPARYAERLRDQVRILVQVADAVAYAHESGIVHRDLKPGNVIVEPGGRAWVTDFGLARATELGPGTPDPTARLTLSGQLLGTPAYMSPELAEGRNDQVGPRSDVWALGVILYELLTGERPFDADHALGVLDSVTRGEPRAPRARVPAAPAELEAVCLTALEKDPALRYATAAEFRAELERWSRGEPVRARIRTAGTRVRRWARRQAGALCAIVAVLLALAGTAGWVEWERAAAVERRRAWLRDVEEAAGRLEDALMSTPLTDEGKQGAAEQTLLLLERCVAEEPEWGPALAWRGRVREMLGASALAEDDFGVACALTPEAAVVWLLRGLTRVERYVRRREVRSWQLVEWRTEVGPPKPESEEEAALRRAGLECLDAAERARDGGDSLSADLRGRGRAMAALAGSDTGGAEQALALLAGKADVRSARLRGLAWFQRGHFDAAVREFDTVVAIWTQDLEARYLRAQAYLGRAGERQRDGGDPSGDLRAAQQDLDARIAAAEDRTSRGLRAIVRSLLAKRALELGEDAMPWLEGALADLGEPESVGVIAIGQLVNRSVVHGQMAVAAAARGQNPEPWYERELADLDRAVALAPSRTTLSMRAGACLGRAERLRLQGRGGDEDLARARADADEAVRLDPDPSALGQRARVLRSAAEFALGRGDPRPALRQGFDDLDRAIVLQPEDARLWDLRGCLHLLAATDASIRGEDPEAEASASVRDLGEAIRFAPRGASAWGNRGLTHLSLGGWQKAAGKDGRASFERALADGTEAARLSPRAGRGWDVQARAARALAEAEAAYGGDPTAAVAPVLEALDRAERDGLLNPGNRLEAAKVGVDLARAEAQCGTDSLARWRVGVARFDALVAVPSLRRNARSNRGTALLRLAWHEERAGLDPTPRLAAAEEDLDAAGREGDGFALVNLALLRRGLGRYREAIEGMEAIRAAAPQYSAWMADLLGSTRALLAHRDAEWVGCHNRAMRAADAGDRAGALENFAALIRTCPEADRTEPAVLALVANAHYNAACMLVRLRVAHDPDGGGPARDEAFAHLEEAMRLGFPDRALLASDLDLAAVRGDARMAELVERYPGK